MQYKIEHLPKEKWQGVVLPMNYTTQYYYDVVQQSNDNSFSFLLEKKQFSSPRVHRAKDYNYPDKLYAPYLEHPYAWGVVQDGNLIAAIETDKETWSNRLRVTELWVDEEYQRQGIGKALMNIAKEQARKERCRAIILETQSCNIKAIDFYLHCGFHLAGLDTCCYHNDDINRKEVRLEFAWYLLKKQQLNRADIVIRPETKADYYDVERMTQLAFWNNHHLGCDEHYLVHKLREDKGYLKDISRIALIDNEVVGAIFYSKSVVLDNNTEHELISFGPLCVAPQWQGCGIGELLVKETMTIAAQKGYKGIVIFGEPDYYPRIGFKTCDQFNITTSEGKNFDAFMAIELVKDGMKDIRGKFYNLELFDKLDKAKVEAFNQRFPKLHKIKFPTHWD